MELKEFVLPCECDFDICNIQLPEISNEQNEKIKLFINITTHVQEIEQLFRIFQVNLKVLLNFYRLSNNDVLSKNYDFDLEDTDDYIINSLVSNYISSAKTLKQSIENFMKQFIGEDNEINIKYNKECLNKLYDDVFSYRLLIRMRDFSQHGHLIVSKDLENRYYFDIEHILSTPHFNINRKLKLEMENIKNQIYNEYGDHPKIAFTLSIAEFNFCIIKTYMGFLNAIEETFKGYVNNIQKLIKNNPNVIYCSNDDLNGLIFFEDNDDGLHCFNPKEDSIKMFDELKEKTFNILNKEEQELEILKQSFKIIN